MADERFQGQDVARLLGETAIRTMKGPLEEVVPLFDEAEAVCLAKVPSRELQREVRRRVAEWKMKLLCDRDAPFESVTRWHEEILKLGYSSLETEANIETYFAQYCIRSGQREVSRRRLRRLLMKLEEGFSRDELQVYRYFQGVVQRLLAKSD